MGISIEDLHNLQVLRKNTNIQALKAIVRKTQQQMDDLYELNGAKLIRKFYQKQYDNLAAENKRAKAKLILLGVKQ